MTDRNADINCANPSCRRYLYSIGPRDKFPPPELCATCKAKGLTLQEVGWYQAVLNACMKTEGCYIEADPAKTIEQLIDYYVRTEREFDWTDWCEGITELLTQLAHMPNEMGAKAEGLGQFLPRLRKTLNVKFPKASTPRMKGFEAGDANDPSAD